MRQSLTFVISLVVFSSMVSALQISPNPIDIEVKVDETKNYSVTLTNALDTEVRDFVFSNLTGFSFPEIVLQANESKQFDFTVNRDSPTDTAIASVVKFNYLVEIPSNPVVHDVDITATGYEPQFLVIHEEDTVRWTNRDDITHTVTSSLFDLTVAPNESVERIFTDEGVVTYQDTTLWFGGEITILNRTSAQGVHNPSYDAIWNVNLVVTSDPTDLEITAIDETNFTVDASGVTEGIFKIKNVGNEIAQSVSLETENNWILFDENNFNLGVGEQKFIDYTIDPIILNTTETNKTYTFDVKAKALNTKEVSFEVNVFIPYKEVGGSLSEVDDVVALIEAFCRRNPNNFFCNNTISDGDGQIIVTDPAVQYNFSTSTILDILRRQRQAEDRQTRLDNEIEQLKIILSKNNPEMLRLLNESLEQQKVNDERIEERSNILWLLGFFAIVVALVGYGGYRFRKYDEKRRIVEE